MGRFDKWETYNYLAYKKGGDSMDDNLGKKAVRYRAKHGMSQASFAKMCGVSMMTVRNVENGKHVTRLTETKIRLVLEEEGE